MKGHTQVTCAPPFMVVPRTIRKKVLVGLVSTMICMYLFLQIYFIVEFYSNDKEEKEECRSCAPVDAGGGAGLPFDPSIHAAIGNVGGAGNPFDPFILSIVILTLNKPESLRALLETISKQEVDFIVDIVVADNGCYNETRNVVASSSLAMSRWHLDHKFHYVYAPICNNPGYAIGNNKAVMSGWVNSKAKWTLFLNDDVTLHPNFLQSMMDMAESKPNAGAVGCILLNENGDEMLEAGSIVWSDGSCLGYGRGRTDIDSSDVTYARPVDYVSGACLMIQSDIFIDYGGFQHKLFPNYYEDTDLQMHVQHDLNKEVWLQPLAKLDHHENGSFGKAKSMALMEQASKLFRKKWHDVLVRDHLPPPQTPELLAALSERGRDLRIRKKGRTKILYMDERLPNPSQGSGFRRSYDNLKMMTDLGHFVTVIIGDDPEDWCDDLCTRNLQIKHGIEVIRPRHGSLKSFMMSRIGFYDVVVASKAGLSFGRAILQKMYRFSPFVLVYDCEALTFRRDELLLSESTKLEHPFPGVESTRRFVSSEIIEKSISVNKEFELELLTLADIIVTVSDQEKQAIHELNECNKEGDRPDENKTCKFTTKVHSVGHLMDSISPTKKSFDHRKGILFIGAFHNRMYYNGDAIWYFVTEIFPLIVKESNGTIPLSIAGRKIPKVLRKSVEQNPIISDHVNFFESPPDLRHLYNQNRVVLAPHFDGAGIQLKLSEAFALGVPVVMSQDAASNFGISSDDEIGCVGEDIASFKQCVLDVHSDRERWQKVRENGLEFIKRKHNQATLLGAWSAIIRDAMTTRAALATCDPALEFATCLGKEVTEMCETGEKMYKQSYPDVEKSIEMGYLASAWEHFHTFGSQEGRIYHCCDAPCNFVETHACSVGESAYKAEYPDVAEAIETGSFQSAFDHFRRFGRSDGRNYGCCVDPKECQYDKRARLVTALEFPVLDGLCEIKLETSRSALSSSNEILPSLERCIDLQYRYCNDPSDPGERKQT